MKDFSFDTTTGQFTVQGERHFLGDDFEREGVASARRV